MALQPAVSFCKYSFIETESCALSLHFAYCIAYFLCAIKAELVVEMEAIWLAEPEILTTDSCMEEFANPLFCLGCVKALMLVFSPLK